MTLKLQPIDQLEPGERFFLPVTERRGTLIHLGVGSASVEYDGGKASKGKTRWGEEFVIHKRERTNISLKTVVAKLVRRKKR